LKSLFSLVVRQCRPATAATSGGPGRLGFPPSTSSFDATDNKQSKQDM
jgi:hypothetical protein